ncbi:MAG: UPF0182 family protein [Thermodesulfobacteriota bacterium]
MQKLKSLFWLGGISICFIGVAYALLSYRLLDLIVDYWWFSSLNYKGYFLLRLFYRYVTFFSVFLFFFLIFFLNFWLASRFIAVGGRRPEQESGAKRKRYRELLRMFQSGSLKVYTPLSLILALPIALPFYRQWETGLLFFFGPNAGTLDPTFGKDISHYLFSLPMYTLVQNKLLSAFLFLLAGIFILYYIERWILRKNDEHLPRGARIHLTLLFILVVAIQSWGFFLNRYALIYTDAHQPFFFGPGYVEMMVDVPIFWLSLVFFILTSLLLLVYLHRRKGLVPLVLSGILFGALLWTEGTGFIQDAVGKYYVKPNEPVREQPYIDNNIHGTLAAYNLLDVETRKYKIKSTPEIGQNAEVVESLHNIPVWDQVQLDDVYKQLQGIRPYYAFPSVDVDRYMISGLYQQVYLAARELDLSNLPEYARNWTNMHLQYTHGYGLVMTPAAQGGDENMTWFVRDMPTRSDYDVQIRQPEIYYGIGKYSYAIVPNELGEIDYPRDEANVLSNYSGEGGIAMSSLYRKLTFALYFKDRNIFLTPKTNDNSRMLLHRNVSERIRRLAPFFQLDSDPYLVSTAKGLCWIQDGYTVSDRYPNSQPYNSRFNYIRNSVKIVVDAYHGTTDFFMADESDPIIQAYRRIYPGLIKPMEAMPEELRSHLRYPKDLFEVQMNIYAKYHQTDPQIFYRQEDSWEISKLIRKDQTTTLQPYYLTINMIHRDRNEFLLLCPMSPLGRNNLRALALAGCDGDSYGKLLVYDFPKGKQVYGPSQIDSLIDQDTEIAQQLTLWDQAGSEVIRGRMTILPVGNMILYVQPVYLSSSTRLKIPELKRLIVSEGEIVAMAPSLEEAFERLESKLTERADRQKRRFQKTPKTEEPESIPVSPALPEGNAAPEPEKPPAAAPDAGGGGEQQPALPSENAAGKTEKAPEQVIPAEPEPAPPAAGENEPVPAAAAPGVTEL